MLIRPNLSAADNRRIQAMLYANNNGGNLRQMLLDGAALNLSNLYYSAIPVRGAVTPSMTRATVKNIQNNDGYQVTLLAGELGFPGARRVYNLWTTDSTVLADTTNKSLTLPAGAYQFSMGAGTGTATFSGTGGATGTLAASASGRVSVAKTITAGTLVVTASVADLVDLQVVSMVAETDQTTIREYVSVGVESSPAYHGSMVDGVKCFPTDLSGNRLTGMATPLIELAATNSVLNNETFTGWTLSGATLGTGFAAPDGTSNAKKIVETAANSAHFINCVAVTKAASAIQYTGSFHLAPAGRDYGWVQIADGAGNSAVAFFNLLTGAKISAAASGTFTGASAINAVLIGGLWRCNITATSNTATSIFVYAGASTDGSTSSYAGDITKGIVAWGGQIDTGPAMTSYIATTTAAVPRNADQFLYTGALFATLKTLATLDSKRESGFTNVGAIVALSDGTTNEYLQMFLGSATQATFTGVDGGVSQWSTNASNAYSAGALSSMGQAFVTNSILMAKDGVAQTPDTVATIPTVNRLEYGMVAGAFQLNGYPGIPYGWVPLRSQSEIGAVTA